MILNSLYFKVLKLDKWMPKHLLLSLLPLIYVLHIETAIPITFKFLFVSAKLMLVVITGFNSL